jgi:hypothetical protein
MTKKTKQHWKYEQLAKQLSLKQAEAAKKESVDLLSLLFSLKAVCIATLVRKSTAITILNLPFGRPKQAVPG